MLRGEESLWPKQFGNAGVLTPSQVAPDAAIALSAPDHTWHLGRGYMSQRTLWKYHVRLADS